MFHQPLYNIFTLPLQPILVNLLAILINLGFKTTFIFLRMLQLQQHLLLLFFLNHIFHPLKQRLLELRIPHQLAHTRRNIRPKRMLHHKFLLLFLPQSHQLKILLLLHPLLIQPLPSIPLVILVLILVPFSQ